MSRFLYWLLFVFLYLGCRQEITPPNLKKKVVEAMAYNRKCSAFIEIPPVDSTKKEIIFLGHSLINEFLVDEYMPHGDSVVFTNMGIGGDDVRGVYNRRNLAFNRKPELIVIELGINDLLNSEPMDSVFYYYGLTLEDAHHQGLKVLVCATIPNRKDLFSKIDSLNIFLIGKCSEFSFHYVDICTPMLEAEGLASRFDCGDNTHLTGAGYKLWADSLKKYLW